MSPATHQMAQADPGLLRRQAGRSRGADHGDGGVAEAFESLQGSAGNAAVAGLLAEGSPLDPALRAQLERSFSTSFADVRVHSGSDAAPAADALDAHAYAVGSDIVFGPGAYRPDTPEGRLVIAHELAHVVQQRGGRGGAAETPGLEADADSAAAAASAGLPATVGQTAGVGVARVGKGDVRKPPVAVVTLYEFVDEDGRKKQVTEAERAELHKQAERRVGAKLRRARDLAENHRHTHEWFMKDVHGQAESLTDVWKNPKSLIGIAVDIRSGVVPPPVSMWGHSIHAAEDGEKALAAGDLRAAAARLKAAGDHYSDSVREWNAYMDKIQEGGQKLVGELEVVRDVSFAIAIVAAAIVAAPVVATGVAAVGATGATATALTALGTGVVTAGFGAGLRGGSEAGASKVVTGKVDTKKALAEAKRGAKEGFVSGVTAGAASGLGTAAGVGTEGSSVLGQLGRRAVVEGTTNALGEGTSAALDRKSASEVLTATAVGFGTGAVTAPLGAAGAKLTKAGKPLLAKALGVGGAGAVAGGLTLAGGGTREEALKNATIAVATTGSLSAATHGGPGVKAPAKPGAPPEPDVKVRVAAEPEPKVRVAAEPEPKVRVGTEPEPKVRVGTEADVPPSGVPPEAAPEPALKAMRAEAPKPETAAPAPKPQQPATPPTPSAAPEAAPPATAAAPAPSAAAPAAAHAQPAAAPGAAPADRAAAQREVVARKQAELKTATERGDAAGVKVKEAELKVAAGEKLLADARASAEQARAAAEQAKAAYEAAEPGSKQGPRKQATAARDEASSADRNVAKAEAAVERAKGELADAQGRAERAAGSTEKKTEALKTSEGHLQKIESAGPPDDAPRHQRGQTYDPKAQRRPNLGDFKDVAGAPVDRIGPSGLRTKPDARVGVFKERVPKRLASEYAENLTTLDADPQGTGHKYERTIGQDITPGSAGADLRQRSTAADKPRISDHGVHEFTVEGELSDSKLDQLWRDLLTPTPGASGARDYAILTVPELSDKSAARLAHMAAVYEHLTGRRPSITVRETGL